MDTKTIVTQFELQSRLFNNVLSEVDDQFINQRVNDQVNHLKWIAAHLLAIRVGLSKFGGLPEDNSLMDYLRNGVTEIEQYPSTEEILNRWNKISPMIQNGLSNLNEEQLAQDAPVKVPVSDSTLGGYLGFLMHHEAYHIGQMGILRKYLGKGAMAYS